VFGLPMTVGVPKVRKFGGLKTETGPTVPLAKAPAPTASEFRPV